MLGCQENKQALGRTWDHLLHGQERATIATNGRGLISQREVRIHYRNKWGLIIFLKYLYTNSAVANIVL